MLGRSLVGAIALFGLGVLFERFVSSPKAQMAALRKWANGQELNEEQSGLYRNILRRVRKGKSCHREMEELMRSMYGPVES